MLTRVRLALIVVAVLVASCRPPQGSVIDAEQSCRQTWRAGTCDVSYGQLVGSYVEQIEDTSISASVTMPIEIHLSVEVGSVRMSVVAADGTISTVDASPGHPARLLATVQGMWQQVPILLEAVDGEASGVRYSISYRMPI